MSGLLRYWCSKACTTRSITESYAKLYVFQRPLSSTCRKTFQQSYQWRFPREPEKNRESEKKGKKESVSKVEAEEEKDEKTENDSSKGSITANKSGLFKLILPLSPASPLHSDHQGDKLLFFLHPRQPLSFISSLIQTEAELSFKSDVPPQVTFHAVNSSKDQSVTRWAASTELGDFVQDAAKDRNFVLQLVSGEESQKILVRVPSFEERSYHLRRRLRIISREISSLLDIKESCDEQASKGAKRLAMGIFGGMVIYWGLVAFLTFGPNGYGWDVMEPITYLIGLSTVMCGYMYFLYHRRDISYRSAYELTTSRRRELLYSSRGFSKDRWYDLLDEGKEVRRTIQRLAQDYDVKWKMEDEKGDHSDSAKELEKYENRKESSDEEEDDDKKEKKEKKDSKDAKESKEKKK